MYITIAQLAKLAGKSRTRIYQYIAEKVIPLNKVKTDIIQKEVLMVDESALEDIKKHLIK